MHARKGRNNASEVALPTLLPARNASEREAESERSGKVHSIQNKMADVFFHLSRSFVLMQTFSLFLLLTDKTRRLQL